MAQSMGLDGEVAAPAEHMHDDENMKFQHPWVVEMFRQGFSFNGGERSQLFLGKGNGTFVTYGGLSGADSPLDGRGLLAVDFDDDFDLDLFAHNIQRERHNLYRNEINTPGHAIKVRLQATQGSPEAVGATVLGTRNGRTQAQVLLRGAGYASSQVPELVFGLGEATEIELRVRWPYGTEESFGKVAAGSRVLLVQGQGKPQTFAAHPHPLPDPWPDGLRIAVGQKIPAFTLEAADGARTVFDPATIPAGSVLHLNLWASYCRPCIEEIPLLDALHQRAGHQVLGVSLDAGSARARALELLQARGGSYPNAFLIVEDDAAGEQVDAFLDLFRLVLPTTLEIDSDGTLLSVHQGRIAEVR
ncbi:MAG TPA: ASPIC/UnbV domain-containing protein [Planctomycetota bacterium]|nr:ASPIC/UnbV domain-containing protein [Planctomycetota bacterium]